jgi:hypothetical protein
MVFDFPDGVVALIVPYLADYRDFRQLLWLCRAGGSILARVQSLDVDGVYTHHGSGGNPFNYFRFHALLRVSVTIRFCLFHVYYDFVQFTGVTELNLRLPRVTAGHLNMLMQWMEHDLSVELRHVGIYLAGFHPSMNLRRPRVRERFAVHIMMLSNHNTLDTFSVSIAGEHFTILWACQQLGIGSPGT